MKNQFENQIDKEMLLDEAFEKATKKEDPIEMKDFSAVYKDVEGDLAYVETMEAKFRDSQKVESETDAMFRKMAKVFEVIISEQIELSNWLDESALTSQASKYDDIKNGVDTIVEFDEENGPSHLALAIDVASGHELNRKFERIKKEISNGVLTEIKYFPPEGIKHIPRVVIGANRNTISDLIDKWVSKDSKDIEEAREARKGLEGHIMQVIIIEEIISQLEAFIEFAESIGRPEIVKIYQKTLSILNKIKAGKNISEDTLFESREDKIYIEINNVLQYFKKQ